MSIINSRLVTLAFRYGLLFDKKYETRFTGRLMKRDVIKQKEPSKFFIDTYLLPEQRVYNCR